MYPIMFVCTLVYHLLVHSSLGPGPWACSSLLPGTRPGPYSTQYLWEEHVLTISKDLSAAGCTVCWYTPDTHCHHGVFLQMYWSLICSTNAVLAIKKKAVMPCAATGMDLEIIVLSEESQRKTKYHIIPLYVESKRKKI